MEEEMHKLHDDHFASGWSCFPFIMSWLLDFSHIDIKIPRPGLVSVPFLNKLFITMSGNESFPPLHPAC